MRTATLAGMALDRTDPSRWLDDFFSSYHTHRPVNATFIGVHDFDHRLPDLSEHGTGDLLADVRDLLGRSDELEEGPSPEAATAVDLRLCRGFLRIQEWELGSEHFHRGNPSVYTGEAVFGAMSLFFTDFAPLAVRMEAATSRLVEIPTLLAQGRANVPCAPREWTERAIRECDGAARFLTEGVASLVAGDGASTSKPRSVGSSVTNALSNAARDAARAFAEHRAHLEGELLGRTHDRIACGAETLDLLIREGHCLPRDASHVLEYAEGEIAKAESHLERHAADHGAATPGAALAGLRALHPSATEYYARYQQLWDESRRISEEKRLLTWPDFPIRYVPRPVWSRAAAPYLYFLFYRSPATYGHPGRHDYMVAPLPEHDPEDFLRANNDSVIKLNHVIHHGGLGHHVQNWHSARAESRVGRIAAVDCASRIAMFCGGTMAEGWACYATDLAAEAGMLTPLEAYAEVHGRVRMAARAIVDVRMHRGDFTLDQAAAFYEERAGMSPAAARGEAVKNSMFPGAALMYLMGTDGVHDLRAEMSRRAGSDFDLAAFHDTFLSHGSLPVSLIAEEMTKDTHDAE